MNFLDLVKRRCSIRGYTDTPVEEEKLFYVLEAARFAPSACNFQPWVFIVLKNVHTRQSFESVYSKKWFLQSPVIIVACCDRAVSWKRSDGKDFGDIDIAIALDHLTLAAVEQGLGTCWIGAFNAAEAKRILKLPNNIDPIALTPLGYPSPHEIPVKTRKNSASLIYWDFFNG